MATDNSSYTIEQSSEGTMPNGAGGKKKKITFIVTAIFLVLLATVLTAYFSTQSAGKSQAGGQVTISKEGFVPQAMEIKKGQSVTWTNTGTNAYYILGDIPGSATGFDSAGKLEPGDTFTYTFDETGTFAYHDRENPIASKGTVTVTE